MHYKFRSNLSILFSDLGMQKKAFVLWLFLTVPWVGLQCVIVVFPDHTHLLYQPKINMFLLFLRKKNENKTSKISFVLTRYFSWKLAQCI